MKKDKALKSMAVISAILSAGSVLLGCMCVISPKLFLSAYLNGYNDIESYSLGSAMPFMLIIALFPLLLTAISVFSALSGTMTYKKGIVSAVLVVIYSILRTIFEYVLWGISINLCRHQSSDIYIILNGVNSVLSMINYLNFFAVLLLISTASIEIYASKKINEVN